MASTRVLAGVGDYHYSIRSLAVDGNGCSPEPEYGRLQDRNQLSADRKLASARDCDKVIVKNLVFNTISSAGIVTSSVTENVEFADGTVWIWAQMLQDGIKQVGTDAADPIIGWAGKAIIHGGAGSNTLYGEAGNAVLKVAVTSNGSVNRP
ncbi:hypothetical protein [Stutzerimonas nitrititolerans]|uniref:hypothetical protein n=1 Tax=Stutzerimonas nitrititolerans TaxID=2482751 RepID=UPI000718465F|nr:hypothetical protein [Stutzerimonas nitrititolerans]KRW66187.1 hypothetical protein AO729_19300 [Pseudomonas sp. TTU2014-066ASC]